MLIFNYLELSDLYSTHKRTYIHIHTYIYICVEINHVNFVFILYGRFLEVRCNLNFKSTSYVHIEEFVLNQQDVL